MLDNNLPFHSVRTAGVNNPIEIPFVKEASSKYYDYLPGMCPTLSYDYINDYIYFSNDMSRFNIYSGGDERSNGIYNNDATSIDIGGTGFGGKYIYVYEKVETSSNPIFY